MGMERHSAQGRRRMMQGADDVFAELYTWNLYGFVNQCHLNELNTEKS